MALQEYKRVHHKHLPGHAIYNFRTGRLIWPANWQ
jgi:hypothetical protein